jgi:class 3 adenylate cyclase
MSIAGLVDSLRSATGESRAVVAIFIDVRGFTEFAGTAESVDTAVFLRKLYVSVLSDYLPSATFAKPTGDGLMVIIEYAESDVETVVASAISGSVDLITGYPGSLAADPMITFPLPQDVGIGIEARRRGCQRGTGYSTTRGGPSTLQRA